MTLAEPAFNARAAREARLVPLAGYAVFHLNLMFSSIPEEARAEVIARCYEPLLDLAEHVAPVGIEASGLTLEIAAQLAPAWIARLRRLIAAGRAEFVGSGYAQAIHPLMPAEAVEKNLSLGHETYRALLGTAPSLALVNEQAWSDGLTPLYAEAGYRAIVMDWDNPAAHNGAWNRHWRYHPQIAAGGAAEVAVLWSHTIAFQKLQRLAHGDMSVGEYLAFAGSQRGPVERIFPLYTNDAECFDFRPGRFGTETRLDGGEWRRIAEAFKGFTERGIGEIVLPSRALARGLGYNAGQRLALGTAECPVPVKKQLKYNVTRWAVTGRDDLAVNTQCWRAYRALSISRASDMAWRELLALWSSDFRTHITPPRWQAFRERLDSFAEKLGAGAPAPPARPGRTGENLPKGVAADGRFLRVDTPSLWARLDLRRGLAIDAVGLKSEPPLAGGLALGALDDIALSPDWYTGNAVYEEPGESKVTDLEWCAIDGAEAAANGDIALFTRVATPKGPVEKQLIFRAAEPRVDCHVTFDWRDWGRGSLRLGHVTLKPAAFEAGELAYATQNGGRLTETFPLAGRTVDLGAPVSFLVSAQGAAGMTGGWLEAGDAARFVRLECDAAVAACVGLVEHKPAGGRALCRLMLSAMELDETRKPDPGPSASRRFAYSIVLGRR